MTETLIILAGGASSRMKKSEDASLSSEMMEQANSRSKALILLNDRPMLDYLLYQAKQAGIKEIILVISPKGELFKEYYGTVEAGNSFHGLSISYAVQHIPEDREKPFGTADAVFQALEYFPSLKMKEFLVCNCDNLYSIQAIKALRECSDSNALINYDRDSLEYPTERIARFALTKTDAQEFLEDIIEKPESTAMERFRDDLGIFRVSMNIFKFDGRQFYDYLKNCPIHPERKEKELPTALLQMVADDPKAVKTIPMAEHVPDLTGKNDIKVMNAYLAKHIPALNWDD